MQDCAAPASESAGTGFIDKKSQAKSSPKRHAALSMDLRCRASISPSRALMLIAHGLNLNRSLRCQWPAFRHIDSELPRGQFKFKIEQFNHTALFKGVACPSLLPVQQLSSSAGCHWQCHGPSHHWQPERAVSLL